MTAAAATSWLEFINTGGVIFILAAIIVYAAKLLPKFLKQWETHTLALSGLKNELENLKTEVREIRHELDKQDS